MDYPPSRLREDYQAWVRRYVTQNIARFADIWLIYPMLGSTCRGKWINPDDGCKRYVYGPCKNLAYETVTVQNADGEVEAKRQAICTIHEHRPYMCRYYPYYRQNRVIEMGAKAQNDSPGYMKGCGYNADPNAGYSPAIILDNLIPLDDDEK